MLIAPSWGGMLNGLLTLRGAWDKVSENPVLKFLVVAVTAYGMSTFEGPMLSLKNVNAISHYTDWTVAHVHIGGLGWNGFLDLWYAILAYSLKCGIPNFTVLKLANLHFWIGTLEFYSGHLPMYWTGFTQSLMWKEFTPDGFLMYPNFLETVKQLKPMYALRAFGGLLYLVGFIVMLIQPIVLTVKSGSFVSQEAAEASPLRRILLSLKNESFHRLVRA